MTNVSWGPSRRAQRAPTKPGQLARADDLDGAFAALLRELREEYQLSQTRLAMLAGYDHSLISRLEMDPDDPGRRMPSREAVLAIATAMGCRDVERDRLLAAGGFMPVQRANLFEDHPDLCDLIVMLDSDETPARVRRLIDARLSGLAQSARYGVAIEREAAEREAVS